MYDKKEFAKNLKNIREDNDVSKTDLAEILGLKSSSVISDYESGRISPSIEILYNISNLFGITTDWLIGRPDAVFSKNLIESLEEKIINLEHKIKQKDDDSLIYFKAFGLIPVIFINLGRCYEDSRKVYGLKQRAKIIFIVNYWMNIAEKTLKNESIDDKYKEWFSDLCEGMFLCKNWEDEEMKYLLAVCDILTENIKTKILEKASSQREKKRLQKNIKKTFDKIQEIHEDKNLHKGILDTRKDNRESKIFYINGILRNRLSKKSYYDKNRITKALFKAMNKGVDLDYLISVSKVIDTWTEFRVLMEDYGIEL